MWAYAWWLVVGVLLGVGIEGLLSVGVFFLLAAVVLTGVGLGLSALRNRSAVAVLAGVGLSVLYLAWLNRDGPGTVCHSTAVETACTEQWSPWPFVAVTLLLVAAAAALAWLVRPEPAPE